MPRWVIASLLLLLPTSALADTYRYAGMEAGNLYEWNDGPCSEAHCSTWDSGSGDEGVETSIVHTGQYAAWGAIDTLSVESGVRFPWRYTHDNQQLPTTALYGVAFYLPQTITNVGWNDGESWWNLMQWKDANDAGADPTGDIDLDYHDGAMHLQIVSHIGSDGAYNSPGWGLKATSTATFAAGQWNWLEAYYVWDKTPHGSLIVYLNGVQVMSMTNWYTEFDYSTSNEWKREFTVNAYAAVGVSPAMPTIYFDDAFIADFNGDLNGDGQVNAADESLWQQHGSDPVLGQFFAGSSLPGDLNHDGAVDAADYVTWRKENGNSTDYNAWRENFGASNPLGSSIAVPETGGSALLLISLLLWGSLSTRRSACA